MNRLASLKVPVSSKPAATIATVIFAVIAAFAALALAGCSFGPGTSGVPGFSKGVITAKGSVWVNGVEFDTRTAAITMNDTSSHPDSDLKVGMVVKVKGTIDPASGKGVAQEVVYFANVEGLIDSASINVAVNTFAVFGQSIAVDSSTVFDGVSGLSALASGDRVEVSGTMNAGTHVLLAARVEKKLTGGDFEIKGIVSALTGASFTLTPDGGSAIPVQFTGALSMGIANGSFVEVKFVAFASPLVTTADRVKLLKDLEASDKDRTEVSGIVSGLNSSGGSVTFTVDGVTVSADSTLASGVSNGIEVEVKGTMNAGVLVAEKIHVDQESNVEVSGNVSAAPDLTAGLLTLDGVVISVNSNTIFRDESAAQVAQFNLSSINVGDHLQVEAVADSSVTPAVAVAERVERLAPSAETSISGPVSAAATNSLTLLGVSVDISGATFTDINGAPVSPQSAFLALLTPGTTVVKVKGTWNGSVFTATTAGIGD
jgi:hypothetical protein